MAASTRRVGAETSKTGNALLDSVETMMLDVGYAGESYRALGADAGVTPSLVQYYVPTLDDILLVAIQRCSERNLALLESALAERKEDPIRALWEFGRAEATSRLIAEFMALGNHRKTGCAEIAGVTEWVRQMQLDALIAEYGRDARPDGHLSLPALQLLFSGLPKLLTLEKGVGVDTAHDEVSTASEQYVEMVEDGDLPTAAAGVAKRSCGRS